MITGDIKTKIDSLWEMLWTEGSTNPLTNIEQLTYLLFMKDLDRLELDKEANANILGLPYQGIFPADKQHYRWHIFKNMGSAQELYLLMQQEHEASQARELALASVMERFDLTEANLISVPPGYMGHYYGMYWMMKVWEGTGDQVFWVLGD